MPKAIAGYESTCRRYRPPAAHRQIVRSECGELARSGPHGSRQIRSLSSMQARDHFALHWLRLGPELVFAEFPFVR